MANFVNGVWENAGNGFWEIKKPYETLGIARVSKHMLSYWPRIKKYENYLIKYFQTGIRKDIEPTIWLPHYDPVYNQYQEEIEGYVKAVWLTHGFFTEGGLRKPIGVHWSPISLDWRIHPGGTRQAIIKYFAPDIIDCMCFNTGGQDMEYVKVFNSVEEIAEYTNSTKVFLTVTEEKGYFIPHIHLDGFTIKPAMVETHERLKKFFRKTKIDANFDLREFGYNEDKLLETPKKNIRLTINDQSMDTKVKAMLLLPSFNNFEGHGVKIERT